MDRPQAAPSGVCTSKMTNFQIWLVSPLGIVKFDEESIGDSFMTDGCTLGSARWGLYVKNVKFSNMACDTSRNSEI